MITWSKGWPRKTPWRWPAVSPHPLSWRLNGGKWALRDLDYSKRIHSQQWDFIKQIMEEVREGNCEMSSVQVFKIGIYFQQPKEWSGLPRHLSGKESACQCRRCGFDPWVGKIPWGRKWHPLQCSCLGNPIDREAWWATVHGVTKSQTWLSDSTRATTTTERSSEAWSTESQPQPSASKD